MYDSDFSVLRDNPYLSEQIANHPLYESEAKLIFFNKSPLLESDGKRCIHIWDKDGQVY